MRLRLEPYLSRRFDMATQNCWHMLRDAWSELTGEDIGDRTPERITRAALIGRFDTDVPEFERLAAPCDPCIVLMRSAGVVPHVGLLWRRKVLQMTHAGPSYVPLGMATMGHDEVSFHIPRPA